MTEFTFKVRKDVITIKQYLTNIERFVNVHPMIYKMTALGENKYKVFEKVMIGIIPYNFTYKAFITHDKDSVKIDAPASFDKEPSTVCTDPHRVNKDGELTRW
ncbi:MAG: hypothetical protein ABIQ02_01975 [Saprospiraceae bacterium]